MNFQTIELTVVDHLARLTLKRPHSANAIDPVMAEELWLATIACEESPDVRAVLITGEGRFFSAGGDLGSFAGAGPAIGEQLAKMTGFIHGAFSKLARMTAPVVIAVNGAAAGAGLSLALLGDIVVAAKSATFTSGYTAAGLTPDGGSTCSWRALGTSTKPRWNARRERSSPRPKVPKAKKASPPSSRSADRTS